MVHLVMKEMAEYFEGDAARINHALKVFGFAHLIGGLEGLDDHTQFILDCAGLLHDIGIHEAEKKHHSTAGPYQEIEGPPIARRLLLNCGIDDATVERVCYLTGHHHSYSKIEGADFQILVEADFIVNIFEDQMQKEAAESIVNKYFRSEAGKSLARSMYLG